VGATTLTELVGLLADGGGSVEMGAVGFGDGLGEPDRRSLCRTAGSDEPSGFAAATADGWTTTVAGSSPGAVLSAAAELSVSDARVDGSVLVSTVVTRLVVRSRLVR